ncbi:glycosyltransferase family 4 protein [Roseateles toxinivorans]|uniref:Glycosyltransferase involved in cell wall biosynthesis n=1 Tax=Roseateles toxinivorans TaxID=270368 RepID=A0A4R6QUW3_9BURK|nr:glycosyltransferase family 4 protein [Roseateles toxinivorans]TDP74615.1 glycosyltransferase involved in cell wall biosynthesis [Roseateles toxinivorans]
MLRSDRRVLLHAFSTFKLGGPQARFVQLANAFGSEFEHVIVAMDNCHDAAQRLNPEVIWRPLAVENRRGGGMANRAAFRRLLKSQKADLLLTYNWGAIEWAMANFPRHCRQLHVEDGFGPAEASSQLLRRVLTRRIVLGLGRIPVLVPSMTLRDIALQQWKLSPSRLYYLPNGVALPEPASLQARTTGTITIGTVASLRPEKNIGRLLRAAQSLRHEFDLRLLIVGDGPEKQPMQALAAELGMADQVDFVGYQAKPQAWLERFDLFALSSDTEQLPIAMLEAMAAGLPVVATSVGDVPRIVPSTMAKALSRPEDADFAAALRQVLLSRQLWCEWGASCRSVVAQRFSESSMLTGWHLLFLGRDPFEPEVPA